MKDTAPTHIICMVVILQRRLMQYISGAHEEYFLTGGRIRGSRVKISIQFLGNELTTIRQEKSFI